MRALVAALLVVSCAAPAGGTGGAAVVASPTRTLQVYAASSLTDVFTTLAARYEASHPHVDVVTSFDASSALRTRIEQGADADVFAAADTTNPARLVEGGLAHGPAVEFASNAIALVVPADNRAAIRSPEDLARGGVRIVAAGDEVPITAYARRVVDRLSRLTGYPAGFAERVARNVVSREDNVRAVLAKIELGEGDAAFVYATDARSTNRLRAIPVPAEAQVVAAYAAVVLARSKERAVSADFVRWLRAPEARQTLAAAGFGVP